MPRPLVPRPVSIEPVRARLAEQPCSRFGADPTLSCVHLGCDRAVAERLGVTRRTVQRWKRRGLTIDDASRIASLLDTHPAELWGVVVWNFALDAHDEWQWDVAHPDRLVPA